MKKSVITIIALLVVAILFFLLVDRDGASMNMEVDHDSSAPVIESEDEQSNTSSVSADDQMDETGAGEDVEGDMSDTESEVKEFTLDSFNFGYSISEIQVNEGDTVTINLTNSDGFHDWVLDEFGAATAKIREGDTTSVTFVADSAGTYEYYCSVGSHRANGMVGTLIVK